MAFSFKYPRRRSAGAARLAGWALSLSALGAALALSGMTTPVQAQAQAQIRDYRIAAGPLDAVLTQFASQAGVQLVFQHQGLSEHRSPGLQGRYSISEGFALLLQGSGYGVVERDRGIYTLQAMTPSEVASLSAVTVHGSGTDALPPVYAGGQVASGGRVGMLGNLDLADAPFNVTSYTSELIENQQARSLSDVVSNDPAVQGGGPWYFDNFFIRGLELNREEIAFDGMYGVASTEGNMVEGVERVEVLKGPSTLLNGAGPRGTAGGGINLVPKRAGSEDLTQVTATYFSKRNVGGHVDIGRRFGEAKQFGIRVNGVYRNGDTAVDDEHRREHMLSAGLDYQGERLRVTLDAGTSRQRVLGATSNFYVSSPVLPDAPDGRINAWPDWSYQDKRYTFGVARAEYDLTDDFSIGLAYGGARSKRRMNSPFGVLDNAQGDINFFPSALESLQDTRSLEGLMRLKVQTGSLQHQLVAAFTDYHSDISNYQPQSSWTATSNLYQPADLTAPNDLAFDQPLTPLSSSRLRSVALTDTISAFDDKLILIVGVRHQRMRVDAFHWQTGAFESRYQQSKTSPAVGLVVKPMEGLSLYANYIEGLSQGDTAPSTAVNANEVFAPIVSKQTEVGAKMDWGRFGTSLSVFQIRRPSGFLGSNNVYAIAGEQRNRGVEWQAYGEVTRGVRVLGGVAWTRAIMKTTPGGTYDGNPAAGVPLWSVKLGGEWDIAQVPGLTLTGRLLYSSSRAFNADNTIRLPAWTRVDLGARYAMRVSGHDVTLRAVVENVANRHYWDVQPAYQTVTYASPRTFRLSASIAF